MFSSLENFVSSKTLCHRPLQENCITLLIILRNIGCLNIVWLLIGRIRFTRWASTM
jgi:hypothetical protein